MSKPGVTITVSWIKRRWLRRLAIAACFPLMLLLMGGQTLLVLAARFAILYLWGTVLQVWEVACSLYNAIDNLVFTAKEQWK